MHMERGSGACDAGERCCRRRSEAVGGLVIARGEEPDRDWSRVLGSSAHTATSSRCPFTVNGWQRDVEHRSFQEGGRQSHTDLLYIVSRGLLNRQQWNKHLEKTAVVNDRDVFERLIHDDHQGVPSPGSGPATEVHAQYSREHPLRSPSVVHGVRGSGSAK